MKEYLKNIMSGHDLNEEDMAIVMENLMLGKYSDIQIAGFLVALAIKSTSPGELATAASVMRKNCKRVDVGTEDFVDVVSTGGSPSSAFNVSTAAMFVAAGAGVPVAKHGNRSVKAGCGSNDVLEMLGVNVHLQPEEVAEIMEKIGICYLFGPVLHPVMKFAMPTRRGLGIQTLFNLLQPMANPAGAKRQLVGTFSKDCLGLMAKAFIQLGDSDVMLVHGKDGMDEITTTDETEVVEVRQGELRCYSITPEQFGIKRATKEQLQVVGLQDRVQALRDILDGCPGPRRDIALLNGAATIYISGRASDLEEGLERARESIDSGKARQKLNALIDLSQQA